MTQRFCFMTPSSHLPPSPSSDAASAQLPPCPRLGAPPFAMEAEGGCAGSRACGAATVAAAVVAAQALGVARSGGACVCNGGLARRVGTQPLQQSVSKSRLGGAGRAGCRGAGALVVLITILTVVMMRAGIDMESPARFRRSHSSAPRPSSG
ncbi:hypothetical protein DFH06DRAFT_55893 [Mycena polygramma]|nr:hypothetical protein DFH06DRAFT_55893 [Mycena polygramma]